MKRKISKNKSYTNWLKYEAEDCGLMQPPLEPQKALDFLQSYLLGEDYYIENPVSTIQANSQVVFDILIKYSKEFRKEYNEIRKER